MSHSQSRSTGNDMFAESVIRVRLKDDDKHDDSKSKANFDKETPNTEPGNQTRAPVFTYNVPGKGILDVGPETRVNEKDFPVCQVCHHLNPDYVQCEKYGNPHLAPWVTKEFRNSGQIRSCSFDIPKGKALLDSANRGCQYCALVCGALTSMLGDHTWESRDWFLDVQLAWGLPVILNFRYGQRHKGDPIASDLNPLTMGLRDLVLESDGPLHFQVDLGADDSNTEVFELYKPENSLVGNTQCFSDLRHLGSAPERFDNLDCAHSYEQMNQAIKLCRSGKGPHTGCRISSSVKLPRRVLYLGTETDKTVKLIETNGNSGLYVALSYRWGDAPHFKMTRSNWRQYSDQIAWEELPPLFKDAIIVSRNLGIYHLWIDALCIVQDDSQDWNEQAPLMGDIYANAYVTITCASAASPAERILGPRPSAWQSKTFGLNDEKKRPALFKVRQRSVSALTGDRDINPDHLATRAWIWQERLLSARNLIFTNAAMKFECRTAAIWEDQRYPGHSFPARMDQDPGIYWITLIEDFTQRDITYSTDRLVAIQSVMRKLEERYKSTPLELTPICGLWRETLNTTLHWKPKNGRNSLKPHASYIAPTWSWASLEGPVWWTIGLADGLPREDKKWDLGFGGIELPSPTQLARTHPIRETLLLEGRFVRGTVIKRDKNYAIVFANTSKGEEFIPDVELVPVGPVPGMTGYHYSTRRRIYGETVDDGDWYGQCGCLLIVKAGQSGTSLVVAPSEGDPNYLERLGVLIHHPVAEFMRQPRKLLRIH